MQSTFLVEVNFPIPAVWLEVDSDEAKTGNIRMNEVVVESLSRTCEYSESGLESSDYWNDCKQKYRNCINTGGMKALRTDS